MTAPMRPAIRPSQGSPATVELGGRDLRYVLTMLLHQHGPLTVARLVTLLHDQGFTVRGRASKEVSDALRWEIGRRRVVRLGRGRYAPGTIPPSTRRRIHRHVLALTYGPPKPVGSWW